MPECHFRDACHFISDIGVGQRRSRPGNDERCSERSFPYMYILILGTYIKNDRKVSAWDETSSLSFRDLYDLATLTLSENSCAPIYNISYILIKRISNSHREVPSIFEEFRALFR